MASVMLGFKFKDDSFFNCEVSKEYWEKIRNGTEGNFYLNRLAGQLASENGLDLSSYTVVEVREAGYYPEMAFMTGQLYQLKDLQVVTRHNPDALRECNLNIIPDTQDMETSDSHWTHGAVLLLLDCFSKHKHKFQNPTMKTIEVWKKIAANMGEKGCCFTPAAAEKKWSNLKIRYKTIVDNNSKTGRGRSRWIYLDRMTEILEGDPSVNPPVTVSSLGGLKVHQTPSTSKLAVQPHYLLLQHQTPFHRFQSHQDQAKKRWIYIHHTQMHHIVQKHRHCNYENASTINHTLNPLHGFRSM